MSFLERLFNPPWKLYKHRYDEMERKINQVHYIHIPEVNSCNGRTACSVTTTDNILYDIDGLGLINYLRKKHIISLQIQVIKENNRYRIKQYHISTRWPYQQVEIVYDIPKYIFRENENYMVVKNSDGWYTITNVHNELLDEYQSFYLDTNFNGYISIQLTGGRK